MFTLIPGAHLPLLLHILCLYLCWCADAHPDQERVAAEREALRKPHRPRQAGDRRQARKRAGEYSYAGI